MTETHSPQVLCAGYRNAFDFDQTSMAGLSLGACLNRFFADERYEALVTFRAMQFAAARVKELSAEIDAATMAGRPLLNLKIKRRLHHRLALFLHRRNYRKCMCDFSTDCSIGPNFWGIFRNVAITASARIGVNAYIEANVTIAAHRTEGAIIGNDVHVRTGAVIIGDIKIGDRVRIGANSLVAKSITDDTTVLGVPARPIFSNPKKGNAE